MPDCFYRFKDKTNSTVVQLNSTLGTAVNELRVTYQRIRDTRAGQPIEDRPFPFVQVDLELRHDVRAGRENFSAANELDQDVFELTDDFTLAAAASTPSRSAPTTSSSSSGTCSSATTSATTASPASTCSSRGSRRSFDYSFS